jgi:hypothetical protein
MAERTSPRTTHNSTTCVFDMNGREIWLRTTRPMMANVKKSKTLSKITLPKQAAPGSSNFIFAM